MSTTKIYCSFWNVCTRSVLASESTSHLLFLGLKWLCHGHGSETTVGLKRPWGWNLTGAETATVLKPLVTIMRGISLMYQICLYIPSGGVTEHKRGNYFGHEMIILQHWNKCTCVSERDTKSEGFVLMNYVFFFFFF